VVIDGDVDELPACRADRAPGWRSNPGAAGALAAVARDRVTADNDAPQFLMSM